MIASYFQSIEYFLMIYGAAAVFLMGLAEEIFFFVPMSLLFLGTGFFIIDPQLVFAEALTTSFLKVALPGTLGVLTGGLIVYGFAYWGGKKMIKRFGGVIGVSWDKIGQLQKKFQAGHIDETLLVAVRTVPVLPIAVVSIFSGFVRLPLWEFLWTTCVGTIFRLSGLALIGWYLGKEYLKYAATVALIEKYIIGVFLLIVLFFLIYFYGKQRK